MKITKIEAKKLMAGFGALPSDGRIYLVKIAEGRSEILGVVTGVGCEDALMMTIEVCNAQNTKAKKQKKFQQLPMNGQLYYVENMTGERAIRVNHGGDVGVYGLSLSGDLWSWQNKSCTEYKIVGIVTGFNVELFEA